ncbi:MAG: hypothetical protein NTZ65_00330 [Candidatus Berkelbacteria bacterium]|nr:hypothetical protein [Candidatus Berkelbacteria bacterium]
MNKKYLILISIVMIAFAFLAYWSLKSNKNNQSSTTPTSAPVATIADKSAYSASGKNILKDGKVVATAGDNIESISVSDSGNLLCRETPDENNPRGKYQIFQNDQISGSINGDISDAVWFYQNSILYVDQVGDTADIKLLKDQKPEDLYQIKSPAVHLIASKQNIFLASYSDPDNADNFTVELFSPDTNSRKIIESNSRGAVSISPDATKIILTKPDFGPESYDVINPSGAKISEISGLIFADSIKWINNNKLLGVAYKEAADQQNFTKTVLYEIDLQSGKTDTIFDSGSKEIVDFEINGNSAIILLNDLSKKVVDLK